MSAGDDRASLSDCFHIIPAGMIDEQAGFSKTDIEFFKLFNSAITNAIKQTSPALESGRISVPNGVYLMATAFLLKYVSLAFAAQIPKEKIIGTAESIIKDRIGELEAGAGVSQTCPHVKTETSYIKENDNDLESLLTKIYGNINEIRLMLKRC